MRDEGHRVINKKKKRFAAVPALVLLCNENTKLSQTHHVIEHNVGPYVFNSRGIYVNISKIMKSKQ